MSGDVARVSCSRMEIPQNGEKSEDFVGYLVRKPPPTGFWYTVQGSGVGMSTLH